MLEYISAPTASLELSSTALIMSFGRELLLFNPDCENTNMTQGWNNHDPFGTAEVGDRTGIVGLQVGRGRDWKEVSKEGK